MLRYFNTIGPLVIAPCVGLWGSSSLAQLKTDGPRIPMLLEMVLDSPTCIVHQNFAFRVRIVNPNGFAVQIRGFEMDSYIEPEVHLLLDDGETVHLRYHASDSAWTRRPVTIPPGGSVEKHRFLWNDNLPTLGWPSAPGIYQLRLDTHLSTVRLEGETQRRRIEWERPIVEVRVEGGGPMDGRAWGWLEPKLGEYYESLRNPKPGDESVGVRKVRIYREFLEHFPDSTYAPAIRWETTKLLRNPLQDWTYVEEHPEAVDLFDECLTFCLKKGGAYAEEFTKWDVDRGGNRYLDLAIEHKRWALVEKILEALDERHPEEEAASLFRRARVVGLRESGEAARRILENIIGKFPEDRYAEIARRKIENIERGWWPPKPLDEETRLYRAAAREVHRSPEKARKMLLSLLERFPNGRYASRIPAIIQAIDDGSWPPVPPQASHKDDP